MEAFNSIIVLCIVLSFCNVGYSRIAPDFIHPCSDITSECLIKAAQDAIKPFAKGLPELGVPSIDPFVVEEIVIDLVGIKTTFHKGKFTGFKSCIVKNAAYNMQEKSFLIDFRCNLTIEGRYTAKGKILTFPIDGDGDAKIDLTNLRIKMNVGWKIVKDNKGQSFFRITKYTYDFDYGDRVKFNFTNIFKESQELSNSINVFFNENWKLLVEEFGKPIVDTAVELVIKAIEKFFHAVPSNELLYVPLPE